ncbi:MAG: SusD/RagB family nutrient-binding outer membrane lipoprotein [Bacteroides sp.]|jgi:hypothetical protein|nr:SusD/RagB family nutrient-binding outer membrane lipoprotein [Bacteroides sp.]
MKNLKIKYPVFLILSFLLVISACTKDFEEYAEPTTTADQIDPKYLFTRSLVTGSGISVGVWQYIHQISGSSWAQHFANIQPNFRWDNYEPTPGNTKWDWYYAREHFAPLFLNYQVIKLSRELNNPIKEAVARIWNVYMFQFLTDTYGDLPYTEAFESIRPAFDSQEFIYSDMLKELQESVQQIKDFQDAGYEGYGEADVLYNGDLDKWIRFGNTLILRLALRVSNVASAELTQPYLQALDLSETMQQNGDMARMLPDPNGATYHVKNPLSFVFGWNEVRMSQTMYDILTGLNDPRMQIMFNPNEDGLYVGLENGQNPDSLSLRYNSYYRPQFCNIGNFFIQDNNPLFMMTYAEACFLKAEAAQKGFIVGSAEQFYEDGIRASMNLLGITEESVIQDYLEGPAAFNSSSALEQIYAQRWIALYPNGAEAWALVRQTGVPAIQPLVFYYPGNVEMPRRKPYPVNERRYNTENYDAAVARMGGDSQYTRVWWDGGN